MLVQAMIREHEGDARWGQHAQAIVHGNMWKAPGNGGHDDKVCTTSCQFAENALHSRKPISYVLLSQGWKC